MPWHNNPANNHHRSSTLPQYSPVPSSEKGSMGSSDLDEDEQRSFDGLVVGGRPSIYQRARGLSTIKKVLLSVLLVWIALGAVRSFSRLGHGHGGQWKGKGMQHWDGKHEPEHEWEVIDWVNEPSTALTPSVSPSVLAESGLTVANASYALDGLRRRSVVAIDLADGVDAQLVISQSETAEDIGIVVETSKIGDEATDAAVEVKQGEGFAGVSVQASEQAHIIHLVLPTSSRRVPRLQLNSPSPLPFALHSSAADLPFSSLSISSTSGDVLLPSLVAKAVHVNTISGKVGGTFNVSHKLILTSVTGDIDATINVHPLFPPPHHRGNESHPHPRPPHKHQDEDEDREDMEKRSGDHHTKNFHGKRHGHHHGRHGKKPVRSLWRRFLSVFGMGGKKCHKSSEKKASFREMEQGPERHHHEEQHHDAPPPHGPPPHGPPPHGPPPHGPPPHGPPPHGPPPRGPHPHGPPPPVFILAKSTSGSVNLTIAHQPPFVSSAVHAFSKTGNVAVQAAKSFKGFFKEGSFVGKVSYDAPEAKEVKVLEEIVSEEGKMIKGLVHFKHHGNATHLGSEQEQQPEWEMVEDGQGDGEWLEVEGEEQDGDVFADEEEFVRPEGPGGPGGPHRGPGGPRKGPGGPPPPRGPGEPGKGPGGPRKGPGGPRKGPGGPPPPRGPGGPHPPPPHKGPGGPPPPHPRFPPPPPGFSKIIAHTDVGKVKLSL